MKRHCGGCGSAFTKKYNIYKLLYSEEYLDMKIVIKREKQLKNWHRDWKINLIKSKNPEFRDLTSQVLENADSEINSG